MTVTRTRFNVGSAGDVSGLLLVTEKPVAGLVLAHGAGAGMSHAFMATVADGLAERGIATLRYQFPYMERGSKRTDSPAVAHAAVRAAVTHAAGLFPALPLFAGGKSFGGRMSSQAQALAPLPGVAGLLFLGFPLHPAGAPSSDRARHLFEVRTQAVPEQVENPRQMGNIRRDIARLLTERKSRQIKAQNQAKGKA